MTRLGVGAALVSGRLVRGDVEVAAGRVLSLGLPTFRGRSRIAAPGFVDLQVNGFAGVDFLTADADAYRLAGEALLCTGVTAFQPTFISSPRQQLEAALRELPPVGASGPHVIGAHLEGPFLAATRLGAHPPEARQDPDPRFLSPLLAAGRVSQMTLAPELPGALTLVDLLVGRGVVAACGHSEATSAEARAAFDRGARTVTHVFNAMRPLAGREPGLAGAALACDDVTLQLILDGVHLANETARVVWRAAPGRVALVTDGISAAGRGDGLYRLGPITVEVSGGVARRSDGALAGSTLTMIQAVRNLVALGASLEDALAAATEVPARIANRPQIGRLAVGTAADVVVLSDSLDVERVLVGGSDAI